MNCVVCDYLKSFSRECGNEIREGHFCDFTGFIFLGDIDAMDIEYPCRNAAYEDYLKRKLREKAPEKSKVNDWRFAYSKPHLKPLAAGTSAAR